MTKEQLKYFPQTREELRKIIKQRIKVEGNEVNLNNIDVSQITNMSYLFENLDFNGDISEWDVSKVKDMHYMFFDCANFNQDISNWNVSNVINMGSMFFKCINFNQDISSWDVSSVKNMERMFYGCKSFNQDISSWDVLNVKCKNDVFNDCPIEEKYKPKFR